MKITQWKVTRTCDGWDCSCSFSIFLLPPVFEEECVVYAEGRWAWLACVRGYLHARQEASNRKACEHDDKAKAMWDYDIVPTEENTG